MKVKFTEEQNKAIETLDKSILVAAAAGSGKTAVLVQRIVNIITQEKADVDEMLIVTFTNAAAAEMRVKLAKAIKKKMKEDPDSRAKLGPQLDKLYRAYICTFNAFAIRIIKEFFYELDMEPSFRICDEVQSTMLQYQAVESLFEEAFEKDDLIEGGSFREFLRLYSSDRNEKRIKESIIDSYGKLRTMPDYFEWAHRKAESLNIDRDSFAGSDFEKHIATEFSAFMEQAVEGLCESRNIFCGADLADLFEEKGFDVELETAEAIRDELREGKLTSELAERIEEFNIAALPGNVKKIYKDALNSVRDELKAVREPLRKELGNLKSGYMDPSLAARIDEQGEAYRYTEYYLKLLEDFERRYEAFKKEEGVLDFGDTEHIAARILKNDDIANTLRDRFRFIFIDEYQDTNNIQESLISRISREDNVFKVGDVKQSIYRFRQAEPAIFQRVYREYASEDNSDAESIDLNKNFRCNPKSVEYINEIFSSVMEGYDEAAKLYPGVDYCPEEYDFEPETHLLVNHGLDAEEDDGDDEADDELRNLSVVEGEAEYVANIIGRLIGTDFYDTVTREVRKVQARDIVILLRGIKRKGDVFAKALRTIDVQSHVEEDSDYFSSVEIELAMSLLMAIDNLKRDVPLLATLHSEAFGFGAEELAEIRAAHRMQLRANGESTYNIPFWTALGWYEIYGEDAELQSRIISARGRLLEWRELSTMMPIDDFVWKVLTESGYYLYAGAMSDGGRRQANLRTLVDKAAAYSKEAIVSLGDFIRYLEVLKGKKVKTAQASMVGKDDDVVRIQTIHKSKGLEYPFVIVAGLGSRFHGEKAEKGFMFDTDLGVSLSYVSPDKKFWRMTLLQKMIQDKSNAEYMAEELRILYVALTRVRNKLILVGTQDESAAEKLLDGKAGDSCFYSVIGDSLQTPYNRFYIKPLERKGSWDYAKKTKSIIASCLPKERGEIPDDEVYAEAARRLDHVYPEQKLKLKAKYSVSELRSEAVRAEAEISIPDDEPVAIVRNSNNQKRKARSTDIGIAYHRIMEFLDFSRTIRDDGSVDEEYIRESAEYLLKMNAIDADAYGVVDLARVAAFFEQELGRRAAAAAKRGSLRKEKAFTLVRQRGGQPVLVQGVIDCCFEEDGEIVLVDYKSSFVRKGKSHDKELRRLRREYALQIEIYSEAVEQGLGMKVGEAYLYLFMTGEALKIEADSAEDARARLGRICIRTGMNELDDYDLSGDPKESRILIERLSAALADELGADCSQAFGPAPHDDVWRELSELVHRAFPLGLCFADDKALAKQVHQLRYVISAQQVEYVRGIYPSDSDEESLAEYFAAIDGEWSDSESDRLHNKRTDAAWQNPLKIEPNIKLVCENFHSEFILDAQGNFLYVLNPNGDLAGIVNGSSFNYAKGNDLWLDGGENPLSVHGLLDVHIEKVDPAFRKEVMNGWFSPSLLEYKTGGIWLAGRSRKKKFAAKVAACAGD